MTAQVEYDEELMTEVIAETGSSTPSEAIDAVLRFFRRVQAQRGLLELQGKVEFFPDYDYKAMRDNPHLDDWEEPCSS